MRSALRVASRCHCSSQVLRQRCSSSSASAGSLDNTIPTAATNEDLKPIPETSTTSPSPPKKRGRPRKTPTTTPSDLLPFHLPTKPPHTSLSTFLSYARTASLSPTSTVYVGTHYEYTTILSLLPLGFSLHRVGGASDLGIDLLGYWTPPSLPAGEQLRVVVQCKSEVPKPGHVRELEGAVSGAPSGWRGEGVVALLVARGEATKGVREAVARGRGRVGFVCVGREGEVRQVMWNARLGQVLEGVGVGMRYEGGSEGVGLTWQGRAWKAEDTNGEG
ncbi:hypothetical protein CAC42_4939 [Sphaceloma murrayae]|uniref:Required for respiratory growth protein 7, mitochondrial n=1 Tax=Sphaceloma murrayae TaxID=2082308 RepID=A0A2K1QPF7_9PEZI|nr:hypothetical protein CAC42_4939 [Sphaceloma murrayae]